MVVSPKYKENKTKTNYNNTIKDAPSLCDKTTLIEKQKVDMCKPRVCVVQRGIDIPNLMVFTILERLLAQLLYFL
jgi:hypothetical protein